MFVILVVIGLAWLLAAVVLALLLGAVTRLRDAQCDHPHPVPDGEHVAPAAANALQIHA